MSTEKENPTALLPSLLPLYRLTQGELPALSQLMESLDLSRYFSGEASLAGCDPIIRSPHKLATATACTQLLIGAAAGAIWQQRSGKTTDVSINIIDALHYLHPTHFLRQQGYPIDVGAESVAVNALFRCLDGEILMLEAGPPYMKLLNGYLNFFQCSNSRDAIAQAVARYPALELETALNHRGLPANRAFSREGWLAHPQGRLLNATPVIEIEKIAPGIPVPFSAVAPVPLHGIRVLDFTHVLAGPRSARTLAEYGADVLHISSPDYPDTFAQHLGVDIGKRNAYLSLENPQDREKMYALIDDADVFTTSYRHDVNRRFDLLPETLAARPRTHGLICLTVNAFGHQGPWKERAGFDQNAQVASGFAVTEGSLAAPQFSPVFYLADLITGYLASAGMMAALLRRSTEGGSYHVKLSLTRSAMWIQELGLVAQQPLLLPEKDIYPAKLHTADSSYGKIAFLASPLHFSHLPLPKVDRLSPYGADDAVWLPHTT